MKILLLGEFSALHKNLKEGLVELGHEAVVAAGGDGFKKIPTDIPFDFESPFPSAFGKVHKRLQLYSTVKKLQGFDVVQMVNPFVFPSTYFPGKSLINSMINNNEKLFLSGAGSDAYFWRYGKKNLKYGPFKEALKYDLKADKHSLESASALEFNNWLVNKVNGVIPIMYEYETSYSESNKRLNTIPIPMNLNKIKYTENTVNNKLVVFHGLNRYGFKGTRHVEEAFDYLRKKYPNDLELVIEGNLPLNEYLELMRRTNVIVDQMHSHSLGMNGVYALAMGKVVIGGAEPESLASLDITSSPVINVKPNAQSLIEKIEKLLENKHQIPQLGYESRQFAQQVHSHTKVAEQYLATWQSV